MAVGFADQGDAPRRLPDKARSTVLTSEGVSLSVLTRRGAPC
jgi:hypothetical protein